MSRQYFYSSKVLLYLRQIRIKFKASQIMSISIYGHYACFAQQGSGKKMGY